MGVPLAERTVGPSVMAVVWLRYGMWVLATNVPVAPESRMAVGDEEEWGGTTTEDDGKFCPNLRVMLISVVPTCQVLVVVGTHCKLSVEPPIIFWKVAVTWCPGFWELQPGLLWAHAP